MGYRVCFALLARDCKEQLQHNIEMILNNSDKFDYVDIVVVENDSIDGTKEYLQELSLQNKHVHVITKDKKQDAIRVGDRSASFHRIERMALYRNEYLNYIQSNLMNQIDYMIVLDADIVFFDIEALVNCIDNAPADFSAIFANGRYFLNMFGKMLYFRYYDLFAFVPQNCDFLELTYREMAWNSDKLTVRSLKEYRYYPCISAFGGIGIYKIANYSGQLYETYDNKRSSYFDAVCEHISFNSKFAKTGGNYISTELLVGYERISSLKQILTIMLPARIRLLIWEKVFKRERN